MSRSVRVGGCEVGGAVWGGGVSLCGYRLG